MSIPPHIQIDPHDLESFCRRWKVEELSVFGSVLRDDFSDDSDVDFLVRFQNEATWTLLDLARMERQLESMVGRSVDLIERAGIEQSRNPYRRRTILSSAERLV